MFSTLREEGLSKPAKALLRLLRWVEKEELPKREPKENTIEGWTHVCKEKHNTNRSQRENSRAIKQPTCTKAGS